MEKTQQIEKDKARNFDVKGGLGFYLPSLSNMINMMPGDFGWAAINANWNKNFKTLKERQEKEGPITSKITLLSICGKAGRDNKFCIHFLKFVDGVFENLSKFLDVNDYGLIRANIHNLLLFHENFINYLGELLVLNSILITKQYKLLQTEYRILDSGPRIDFLLNDVKSNKEIPVEVINITLEDQRFDSYPNIDKFLRGKLENKLKEKDLSEINYALTPVIWAINTEENHNLERLIKFFIETNFKMDRVQTPFVHSSYNNPDGSPVNIFGSIFNCYKPADQV